MTDTPVIAPEYGDRLAAVEPFGTEVVPASQRHGRARKLLWTWSSPNLEFATIFIGVLAVAAFGLSFWQAVAAVALGNLLGGVAHGIMSTYGPRHGVAQMVLGRAPFGYRGNLLPAGLNTVAVGIGWFAVNSVSGALALATLTGAPKTVCLLVVVAVQVAVAFFGHNLVHAFANVVFPVLAVTFAIAALIILSKADLGASATPGGGGIGAFLLAMSAAFGYSGAWSSCAADYSRYLPKDTNKVAVALYSGLGVFLGCTLLQIVGAASATIGANALGDPTGAFTAHLPNLLADATLLAIALGAICANAINIYSGTMSFLTLDITLPFRQGIQRAATTLTFGVVGLAVAWYGLRDAGHAFESFLLVVAYWLGPWMAVMFADRFLRRGEDLDPLFFDRAHRNWAGPVAMAVGIVGSVWLFANQERFHGVIAENHPGLGDITFVAGFVIAAAVYAILFRFARAAR